MRISDWSSDVCSSDLFKLEKEVVRRRADLLERGGIVFHLNCDVGSAESFAALRRRHDAVLVATGVYKARDIKVPGCGLGNIFRSEEHTSELQSLMRTSYAVFCLKKKNNKDNQEIT